MDETGRPGRRIGLSQGLVGDIRVSTTNDLRRNLAFAVREDNNHPIPMPRFAHRYGLRLWPCEDPRAAVRLIVLVFISTV